MKTVKPAKSFTYFLFTPSSYLTKMEILLIFMLAITAYYAMKMDKPVADNKAINSSLILIEDIILPADSLRGEVALAQGYFMEKSADAKGEIIALANHQQLLAL